MSGRKKQPLSVVQGNGKKHLTKNEIEQRKAEEELARGPCDNANPPSYLTAKQKKEFAELAEELKRVELFSNLDVDTLAQYIDTRSQYIDVIKALKKFKPIHTQMSESTRKEYETISREYASLQRTKDLLIRQCRSLAGELGLTLNARLKLVVPKKEEKKESKFSRFGGK